jgi:hypothetical protein
MNNYNISHDGAVAQKLLSCIPFYCMFNEKNDIKREQHTFRYLAGQISSQNESIT